MKKISKIIILVIAIIVTMANFHYNYAAFADLEYPPDSNGKVDYTEEEANKNSNNNTNPNEDFVGKSSNNNLKNLEVENLKLEPEFNRQQVDYIVNVDGQKQSKIVIKAEAEDPKAKVEGLGEFELESGENNFRVIVTAENGNVQIYNILVNLPLKQSGLVIENLKLFGTNIKTGKSEELILNPLFDSKIYQYDIRVENEITNMRIEGTPSENSYIKTEGLDDLEEGNNKITIQVISNENEKVSTTYQININRKEAEKKEKSNSENKDIILILVIILSLIVVISVIRKKERKNRRGKRVKRK